MTTQTIQQLLTDFATYLGEQDKALYQQLEAKINQLKASGSSAPEALTIKLTEFKQSLDGVIEQINALKEMDLKAAYLRGKNS